jgi:hypothetical protein
MAKKNYILLLIFTIGFFMVPNMSYACEIKIDKVENSCGSKEKTDKNTNKDCCINHKTMNDDCNSNCNHHSCSCPTVHYSFNLPFSSGIRIKTIFAENKKLKFYHNETFLSSGFYSIWKPPNIG